MPLTTVDLPPVEDALRVLYRILVTPTPTAEATKIGQWLWGPDATLDQQSLITAGCEWVLHRLMPSGSHTRSECPDIAESTDLTPQQKKVLFHIRKLVCGQWFNNDYQSEASAIVGFQCDIRDAISALGEQREGLDIRPEHSTVSPSGMGKGTRSRNRGRKKTQTNTPEELDAEVMRLHGNTPVQKEILGMLVEAGLLGVADWAGKQQPHIMWGYVQKLTVDDINNIVERELRKRRVKAKKDGTSATNRK